MRSFCKQLFAALVFVVMCFASMQTARAEPITLTVGPINSNSGVFNFVVPASYQITSATLRSTSVITYLTQALPIVDFQYQLDGQLVGRDTIILLRPSPGVTLTHNYRFNVTDLSLLQDGIVVLNTNISISPFGSANAFTTNSILEIVAVPTAAAILEPTTILLFGTGLAGVAARVRRRRKH